MVSLAALWLPILLSAVIVFVASSIMHMLLPYHRNDYSQLPDEDKILAVLCAAALKRGLYVFPLLHTQGYEVARPARKAKARAGRVPDHPSQRPARLGKVPDPVVCLLPRDRILRRLSRRPHACTRHKLSGGLSRRRNRRLPRLRPGKPEQRHLERSRGMTAVKVRPGWSRRAVCGGSRRRAARRP